MNKQEIIEKLRELLRQPALDVQKEVRFIEKEYKKIWTEEFESAKQKFIDEGGKAKDFIYNKSKEDDEIIELLLKFENKKEAEEQKLQIIQEENKRKKEELISKLEALAEVDVKDITPIVKKLREIQNEWKSIKELKKADYVELQRKYNTLLDKINENIKVFTKLQEYDLQKNTQLKEELLNKFEKLLSLDDIKKIEDLYKTYKKEWNQVGNVISEKYIEIRTRFNEITQKIKEKLDAYYQLQEEEKNKNLEKKNNLLIQLKSITEQLQNSQEVPWKEINEKVLNIKSEWESIGHIPFDAYKKINEQYNHLLDIYYDAKRKHIEQIQKKQEEIKNLKEKLLQELEALSNSKNFERDTKRVIQLQQEWKKHRLKDKEAEESLNQRFKELSDKFFENKRIEEKNKIQEERDNLVKKLELIHRLKETEFDKTNPESALQKIQEFIKEWNSIGHVPIEEKDKIHDDFFSKIHQLYSELNLSEEKRYAIQYKAKLQHIIQSSQNPIETLQKEEKFIKKKIAELENELSQIENNLAFFKNSKPDNPLLKEAYKNKERVNSYISEWRVKHRVLQGMLNDLKKAQQST